MASLSISGIFSGMDTDTLVAGLMQLNRRPLDLLEARQAQWQSRQSAVADLQSRLNTLKTLMTTMRDAASLRRTAAVSSDRDVVAATAGASASEGTHQVVVNRLASAQTQVHTAGLAGLDSVVGAAKSTALNLHGAADPDATWFTTTANGATYTLDFGSETDIDNVQFAAGTSYSLNQAAALINVRSQAVAGYDAAAVEYDSQEGQYFLRLTAESTDPVGTLAVTLTAGDAVAEINDTADWLKTNAGTGQFVYTYDGVTRTIQAGSGTTLEDLAELINNDGANPGVQASILNHGGAYHLVLTGRSTGGDYTVEMDDFQTTLEGFDSDDFTVTQEAQDAQIRVNGYPEAPAWIERSGNTVSDVIPGVSLDLKSAGTVTITLNRDTAALRQDVTNLVAIYNGLVDKVAGYTGYDAKTKTGGVLQGDMTVRDVLTRIRSSLTSAPAGFVDGEDPYTLAAQIGLKLDRYGKLSVVETSTDTDTSLEDALSEDYFGVLSLIGALGSGVTDDTHIQFVSAEEDTVAGFYEVEVDFHADGSIATGRIRTEGEVAWRYLEIDGNTLLGAAGNPEEGLELTAVSDGTPGEHTQSASLRIRQGVAGAIYDTTEALLDETTGAIAKKTSQIETTLDSLDEQIERQEDRLEAQEKRLRAQFARLEALLAQMDSYRGAYQALFSQLESTSNARKS